MKESKLTAIDIKEDQYFMVMRTHKWYKKKRHGNTYTEAYILEDNKKYLIPNSEPVIIQAGSK